MPEEEAKPDDETKDLRLPRRSIQQTPQAGPYPAALSRPRSKSTTIASPSTASARQVP